jgi:hypothetical protein
VSKIKLELEIAKLLMVTGLQIFGDASLNAVPLISLYSKGRSAVGKSLSKLNFSDLGCPNQLVLCHRSNK